MPAPSFRRLILIACLLIVSAAGITNGAPVVAAPAPPDQPPIDVTVAMAQPNVISYWGMNLYLTKRERLSNNDNLSVLATSALDAGVHWTREELPWDLIE